MVNSAGSSAAAPRAEEETGAGGPAGVAIPIARGKGAVARAAGVSEGRATGSALSSPDSARAFDGVDFVPFFLAGVASSSTGFFFLLVAGLIEAFGRADSFLATFAFFGVASSSASAVFFFFALLLLGVGDLCGVGEGLFFDFAFSFLGEGVGDSSDESELSLCPC